MAISTASLMFLCVLHLAWVEMCWLLVCACRKICVEMKALTLLDQQVNLSGVFAAMTLAAGCRKSCDSAAVTTGCPYECHLKTCRYPATAAAVRRCRWCGRVAEIRRLPQLRQPAVCDEMTMMFM
jgi:hypothetical protein